MAAVVVPRGTSWVSVLCGWIASLGMMALLAPLAASAVVARGASASDIGAAVPAIIAIALSYLVGGYVAGRMAGYRTSWHGLMTAFWGLFVVLALLLIGVAAASGAFGDLRVLPADGSYAWTFGVQDIGDALTFGAIVGFLIAIFAGWLGGLLAPSRIYTAAVAPVATTAGAAAPVVSERRVERVDHVDHVDERPRRGPAYRLLPQLGRKGGERVARDERTHEDGETHVRETHIERR